MMRPPKGRGGGGGGFRGGLGDGGGRGGFRGGRGGGGEEAVVVVVLTKNLVLDEAVYNEKRIYSTGYIYSLELKRLGFQIKLRLSTNNIRQWPLATWIIGYDSNFMFLVNLCKTCPGSTKYLKSCCNRRDKNDYDNLLQDVYFLRLARLLKQVLKKA
ncbi:hypothetical protein ACFE04_014150 [Oxalis oulophora]